MSSIQRIIKYFAIAIAFLLIFSIMSGIVYGISSVVEMFKDDNSTLKLENIDLKSDANIVDIDLKSTNLVIKQGSSLKAETNNKYIIVKQDQNKLNIKEKKHNWFSNRKDNEVIIYIPHDMVFEEFSIDAGAGKVDIEKLTTKELDLNLGAGKVTIKELEVLEITNIESGAGEVIVKSGYINNLDLNMGVGKTSITTKLNGNNKIEAGIGAVILNLIGTRDDYNIIADKGIDSIRINGENIKTNTHYGTGTNKIDIDGGIGSIDIDYKD